MKVLIVTANNGLPYVEVCMSSIHNHNFSIYFNLPALKKRVLIIKPQQMLIIDELETAIEEKKNELVELKKRNSSS